MEESKFKLGDKVCCTKICGNNSCADSFSGEDEITRGYVENCRWWYEVSNSDFSYLEEDLEFADKKFDVVNNPKHYCNRYKECIDEFEMIYGTRATITACLFNIHKYRFRAADKNGQEDIDKSDYYGAKIDELKNKLDTPEEVIGVVGELW